MQQASTEYQVRVGGQSSTQTVVHAHSHRNETVDTNAYVQMYTPRIHTLNKQMVGGHLWSLQLNEKVTFFMLMIKFSCQAELFPVSQRAKKQGNGEGEGNKKTSDNK